jgi:phospholipid-transporting ATPase
MQTIK